jgi:hypothetical protein
MRAGTVDEAPTQAMNDKTSIVAEAALRVRTRLEQEYGRKGDLQTLARLINIYPPALAWLYDEIVRKP